MTEPKNSDPKRDKRNFSSRYALESKLGTGGMGVVYKAYDEVLKKPVAVKVLLPNSQTDAIIRFHQEAKMIARLSHANILTVLDFGQNEAGDLYLVMDFLDGESLHERLKARGGTLPVAEALGIFLQICAGLQHAHSQGVLHRDIKPSNIMLVKEDRGASLVKIVDFGLAKVEGAEQQSLTTTGIHVGSPLYMSPEQAQTSAVDHRSDIYSLGCLMYKTLTGKTPFLGETLLLTLNMHVNEMPLDINDVNPNLHFPDELAEIVLNTLEKDPDDRFQSCQSLMEALLSLDISFLSLAPPVMPESTELQTKQFGKKNSFSFISLGIATSAIVMLFCMGFIVKSLLAFLEPPEPTKPIKAREEDTGSMDVLTDNLFCHPDGRLSANADFGDEHMDQLKRFSAGQRQLSLSRSQVTGKNFSKLRKMKVLVDLNLSDTKIDDSALKHVGRMKQLTKLNLDRDRIGDIGLEHLLDLQNLKELKLEQTLITNLGVEKLPKLGALQMLDISGCTAVTGSCLDSLTEMPTLRALYAVQCPNIKKADVVRFGKKNRTCVVILDGEMKTPAKELDTRDDPKLAAMSKMEALKKLREREARPIFLKYKNDMQNPKFRKFFENNKDCWKPRTSYAEIRDPRIVAMLKDQALQEVMKDPELARRWTQPETWVQLQQMEDKMKSYMPPEDYGESE